jgi:hypothetical protein
MNGKCVHLLLPYILDESQYTFSHSIIIIIIIRHDNNNNCEWRHRLSSANNVGGKPQSKIHFDLINLFVLQNFVCASNISIYLVLISLINWISLRLTIHPQIALPTHTNDANIITIIIISRVVAMWTMHGW